MTYNTFINTYDNTMLQKWIIEEQPLLKISPGIKLIIFNCEIFYYYDVECNVGLKFKFTYFK